MAEDVNCPISVADRERLLADPGLSDALRGALTSAADLKKREHGHESTVYEVGLTKALADELLEHAQRLGLRSLASDLKQELNGLKSRQRGKGTA